MSTSRAENDRRIDFVELEVTDVEAAVRGAGGTIVRPAFSFPGGRRFHFADPSGNVLAVWSDA